MEPIGEIAGRDIALVWPSVVAVTMIALVHLLTPRFRFMQTPNSPWLPMSAGVALAYVFMDIFPHLAKVQKRLVDIELNSLYGFLATNVYLMALIGFCIYLGITLLSIAYRQGQTMPELTYRLSPVIVKIDMISLALYNFLVGYLLAEQATHRPEPVIIFATAMAIHFIGVDSLIRELFQSLYDRTALFLFIIGIYAGWLTGVLDEISDAALSIVYAFLAGGIIVVATVHELPGIKSIKQYVSFLCGAAVFSALLLAFGYF